ncbi:MULTISPECIES: hypothetical protein [unclassified Sphingomonas]|uniref:hypothetical protein n=1 Tax=unclassified Sphingomonas TaxID=196159 RepID=UPI0006F8FC49|nr:MULTISPECIES: hypothetical protein [unclassified Sphingomonas]KQM27840.1 hypothetical protein ASE58_05715 [Sphingomonas sp. Leaf9]KQM44180.1 hypothetical protein ASE57_05710 [Sphingomonas sp. Leaf11]
MIALTLYALAAFSIPDEPLAGQLRAAIWDDLQRNAMIGNGNRLAASWYDAGHYESPAPRLHIQALDCTTTRAGQRCSFNLWREGGPRWVLGEVATDRLSCRAQFVQQSGEWSVLHRPPPGAGHSRTDMRCRVIPGTRP